MNTNILLSQIVAADAKDNAILMHDAVMRFCDCFDAARFCDFSLGATTIISDTSAKMDIWVDGSLDDGTRANIFLGFVVISIADGDIAVDWSHVDSKFTAELSAIVKGL